MFDIVFIHPLVNLLVAIYHFFIWIHLPNALGFAIIALTVVIRLLLAPMTNTYLKSSKKMQELTPHLNKVKERHKGDSQRIQQETMRLYKEHGVNPFAGCLPMLLQIPVAWGLYSVLQKIVGLSAKDTLSYVNHIVYNPSLALTQIWDTHFFGIPLGKSPHTLWGTLGLLVAIVPILTALLQFIQSKMMLPVQEKKVVKKGDQEDFSQVFQAQSLFLFPIMIGFAAFNFPIALALYWNTFTIFGILQQYLLHGLGGLEETKQQIQSLWQKKK